MPNFLNLRISNFLFVILFVLTSCKTIENLPGGDAREISPDPKERVKKNIVFDSSVDNNKRGSQFRFTAGTLGINSLL